MSQMKAGAVLSYLSIFITILIALLYTPIMIRLLGQSEYGLYSLIGSVSAYFSVLDLGLGNAIVRYTARNRAVGDKKAESKLNGMFLILYSFIGFLTIIIGLVIILNIENIFGGSLTIQELGKAKIMVLILIVNFAFSFPLSIFGSIIQAYEKFIVFKTVEIMRSVLIPIITLPILFLGYGSVAMVVIVTLVNISCLLFNAYYSIKKLNITFFVGKIDFRLLKEIIGYSFFIFLNVIVDQIYWQTDQVILGIVSGTVSVAVYAIGMQFITLFKKFSTAIAGLFLPRVSMMVANNATDEEFTNVMIKYGRLQYIIMAFIFGGFFLIGKPFIQIWAGPNYSQAYNIVLLIMIPLIIPLIQNIGISILQAKNMLAFRSVIYIILAVFNIIISIPLAKYYGGIGTAISTGLSLLLGHIIIMNIYYHKKIGINMISFWKNIIVLSVPVLLSIIIGLMFNNVIQGNSILYILLKGIFYIMVYVLFMWLVGFNKYEKDLSSSMINSALNVIRSRLN